MAADRRDPASPQGGYKGDKGIDNGDPSPDRPSPSGSGADPTAVSERYPPHSALTPPSRTLSPQGEDLKEGAAAGPGASLPSPSPSPLSAGPGRAVRRWRPRSPPPSPPLPVSGRYLHAVRLAEVHAERGAVGQHLGAAGHGAQDVGAHLAQLRHRRPHQLPGGSRLPPHPSSASTRRQRRLPRPRAPPRRRRHLGVRCSAGASAARHRPAATSPPPRCDVTPAAVTSRGWGRTGTSLLLGSAGPAAFLPCQPRRAVPVISN